MFKKRENEGQCHYLGTHIIIARFNGVKNLLFIVLVQSECAYIYEVRDEKERERE
jgi:hypothetical protein